MTGSIVVGAVRGCPRQLGELLELGAFFPDHRWVFLGSYLGKGPDPETVVHILRGLDAECFLGAEEKALLHRWRQAVTPRERRDCLDEVGLSQGSLEWLATLVAHEPPSEPGGSLEGPLTALVLPELWTLVSSPTPGSVRRPPVVSNLEALMDEALEEL